MLPISKEAQFNQIALISCHASDSLITPTSNNIVINELYIKECSNVLIRSNYDQYQLLIIDSFFDKNYYYSYLTNCTITATVSFELTKNAISDCAYDIKLYDSGNTKKIDLIVFIIVIVILVVLLSISIVWNCFIHTPLDDDLPKADQQLKMTLPLVDDEKSSPNDAPLSLQSLTLKN